MDTCRNSTGGFPWELFIMPEVLTCGESIGSSGLASSPYKLAVSSTWRVEGANVPSAGGTSLVKSPCLQQSLSRCHVQLFKGGLDISHHISQQTYRTANPWCAPTKRSHQNLECFLKICLSWPHPYQMFSFQYLESGPTTCSEGIQTLWQLEIYL